MYILGIDPGISGAIAVFKYNELIQVFDMPVKPEKGKMVMDTEMLAFLLDGYRQAVCFIEFVHAMPGQGVSSMFKFGFMTGIIHGVCACNQVRVIEVSPQVWKGTFGLTANKDFAREKALKMYPKFEKDLNKKKHHGRAEAILIGTYGVKILANIGRQQQSA